MYSYKGEHSQRHLEESRLNMVREDVKEREEEKREDQEDAWEPKDQEQRPRRPRERENRESMWPTCLRLWRNQKLGEGSEAQSLGWKGLDGGGVIGAKRSHRYPVGLLLGFYGT